MSTGKINKKIRPLKYRLMIKNEYKFHNALSAGKLEAVEEKLKAGFPINSTLLYDETPLHLIVKNIFDPEERLKICSFLLSHGADVNVPNKMENAPLHFVSKMKDEELLKLLVNSKNADVNLKNGSGDTPLIIAVRSQNARTVEILLDAGADPSARNSRLVTPLTLAVQNADKSMVRLLLTRGAKPNDRKALAAAAASEDTAFLRLILFTGSYLNGVKFADVCIDEVLLGSIYDVQRMQNTEYLIEFGTNMRFKSSSHFDSMYFHYRRSQFNGDEIYLEFGKLIRLLVKHHVIERNLGRSVIVREYDDFLRGLFENFSEQVEHMKNLRVSKRSKITYFDFITKTGRELTECCNDATLADVAENIRQDLFPDFVLAVKRNIRYCRTLRSVLKSYKQTLFESMGRKLPFELICQIFDYLKMEDLREFCILNVIKM